jgi:DNA-binding response OmpR family regulator
MANPRDKRVIDELEFVTGRKVYPYVAITTTLERAIAAAYDAKDNGSTYYAGPNAPPHVLRQLGVDPDRRERDSVVPGSPPVVVDEQVQEAADESDLSTSDFGELGEEVSRMDVMSDELRAAADAASGVASPSVATSGKTILVVDDEDDIRRLCKRILTEKSHRVIEADRGLTALRLVKEETPDLILLDAMLPEIHGFDIAKRIKGSEKYGSIPILMMSAVHRGWRIAEDLKTNYGIEDYIEKPFRIADLLSKVTRLLAQRDVVVAPRDPEEINRNAAKYLEEGIAAYKSGEVDLSIALLKKGISVDPLAYRLRYHLALIYGKKGLFYDGITELERAVDLNPKHFPALKNLAVLYEKAGFKNKAVEMWERCVHTAPDAETRTSIKEHLMKLL